MGESSRYITAKRHWVQGVERRRYDVTPEQEYRHRFCVPRAVLLREYARSAGCVIVDMAHAMAPSGAIREVRSVCEHPEDGFCAIDPEPVPKVAAKPIAPRRVVKKTAKAFRGCADCGADISHLIASAQRCHRCKRGRDRQRRAANRA